MTEKEKFREVVAALCHEQWAGWMLHMIGKSQQKSDGTIAIPPASVEKWRRQMTTAYENLSEHEKKNARIEADKFIRLFGDNQAITEIAVLADIYAALDVDEKPMLTELPAIAERIRSDAERYKKVCTLTPQQFSGLWIKTCWLKAFSSDAGFDDILDAWIEKQRLSADKQ